MKNLWTKSSSKIKNPLAALLRASNYIGEDSSLVLHGGGNSSVKASVKNFKGKKVRALYVKGSGSDMRSLSLGNLAPLNLEDLLVLLKRKTLSDEAMVAYLKRCLLEPEAPRPSIETLLHAFLPSDFIIHTHADATAALLDNPHSKLHVQRCYDGKVGLVPYQRPGFALSVAAYKAYRRDPEQLGILLDKHGLITWGSSAEQAYLRTIHLVGKAQRYLQARLRSVRPLKTKRAAAAVLMPRLRGALSQSERQILYLNHTKAALDFAARKDAKSLCQSGPATPDHLLYTKPQALFLDPEANIQKQVLRYRRWYDAYFKKYASRGLIKMDSAPRVIVVPGLGVITTGKDPRAAAICGDLFEHSMFVRTRAVGLGGYKPITLKQICDFEYWPLENFKLTLLPAEKELSRRVAVITGAGSGIGKACARRLAAAGTCVAVLDINTRAVIKLADELNTEFGSGRALGLRCDITQPREVSSAFDAVAEKWGGLDILVSNAGLAKCSPIDALPLKDWEASFAVNATGHFLCAQKAIAQFKAQNLGGAVVFVSSKNVLAPGKDFSAYSASKAAQTQLAKVMALELAPYQVRVNCVTPDGIFEDSRLWDQIAANRAKTYGLSPKALPDFYANRNLLKQRVYAVDVAEAVLFLASDRSSKTTGTLLPVDGGMKEAFPR